MAVDFLFKRDIIEQIIPSDALAVAFNSGTSGSWSAWSQIIAAASLTYDFILCGVYVLETYQVTTQGTQAGLLNLQIGTGAAGSETPVSETHGMLVLSPGGTAQTVIGMTGRTHFTEPVLIPANTRIAVRATASTASGFFLSLYLFGYQASSFGLPLKYVNQERYIKGLCSPIEGTLTSPSPGVTNVTSGGTYWGYGSWVEFIASAATPLLITGAVSLFNFSDLGLHAQAKIGIGAAGSEVAMSKVGFPCRGWFPPAADCYLPRPLFVKTGERVAVQTAASRVSTAVPVALKYFSLK